MNYRKWGTEFSPYPDDPVFWVHRSCAAEAGARLGDMPFSSKCHHCGEQYFPTETAVELVSGTFSHKPGDPEPGFAGEELALTHWACLASYSNLDLVWGDEDVNYDWTPRDDEG